MPVPGGYWNALPNLSPPLAAPPRLRLWDEASGFEDGREPTSLTLFEPCHGEPRGPLVREVVWQRGPDLQTLHAAVRQLKQTVFHEPTIAVRDAEVPADRLTAFLREAALGTIPVVWLDPMKAVTSDCGTVGFEFFSQDGPPAVLRLTWSYDTPEQWEPVKDWVTRLRAFLESCFAGKSQ
jgi:hypothetical protein